MGKGLNELELKDEALPAQSLDDLPEFGGFTPPPQPGAYRFQLPGALDKIWDTMDTQDGQAVVAIFDRDHALLIKQSPGGKYDGDSFQTRINSAARKRGKDGPKVSDMDYLLRAFGEKQRPGTLRGYIEAVKKYAGREFSADISYSWVCSDKRDIYVYDPNNAGQTIKVEGQKGCGQKYYQKDVSKVNGEYPHEVQCQCGAVVRCFANLDNIRA